MYRKRLSAERLWKAHEKAVSQNKANEAWMQNGVGSVKATPPSDAPVNISVSKIHQRWVAMRLTYGIHNGFSTHGR